MTKLIWLLVLAAVGCRMLTGKWPWQWLGSQSDRKSELVRARRLLDVPADATRQEINEAHRRLIAAAHPDHGGTNARAHEANHARELLLNNLPAES
ncbi:MAG: molecular chaperone DnaJ [Sphingomonadaceae bacterium]|nr:molecular chaperone DnaJ [Sphingomonadaceae bacterium]